MASAASCSARPYEKVSVQGFGPVGLVDRVQMASRQHVVLATGQERDTRHRRRHVPPETPQRGGGDLFDRRLLR